MNHKRGVENVIHFQSLASFSRINYYIHWDTRTSVCHYEDLICIGINKNSTWILTLNLILYKIRKKNKYIFIHSHNPLMSIVSFYRTNLLTVHDALYYLTKSKHYKLNKFFWILEKLLYFKCNYIHFISDFSKKMSLFRRNDNFVIIPNTSHFEQFKLKSNLFNSKLKTFIPDKIKVLIVRSIEERALIDLIIEVAKKLNNENFEFLIAGKGPLLNYYRERICELGLFNITLLGYISDSDLINYYKNCDIVLVSSGYGEGFGLPIIEGYLFDKPVIASNVCAIPEVIFSKDFLFENEIQSVIEKLYFALDQHNINFNKYYDNYFSNKEIVFKMKNLYKSLL